MKGSYTIWLAGIVLLLASCGREDEITVTEPRELTMMDSTPRLDVDDKTRFGIVQSNTPPASTGQPVKAPFTSNVPEGWVEKPGSRFRILNYGFGASGTGEAYLSVVGGQPLENINRWMKQFGVSEITTAQMNELPETQLLGQRAKIVDAVGTFSGGMGRNAGPKGDWALAGIVGVYESRLVTIKMIGPKDEVAAERDNLLKWSQSIVPNAQ